MTDPDITDLDPIFAQWAQEKLRKRFRRPKYKTLVAVDTKELSFNKCGETKYHKERGTEDVITYNESNNEFENNSDTANKEVITVGETTKSSYEWSQTKGYTLSASASVNVGLPTVGGLTAKGGVEFQLFKTKTEKSETEDSHGIQKTVDVQPWSKVRVSIETTKKVYKMAFSLSVYLQGKVSVEMKKDSGKTKTVSGDVVDIMQKYGKGAVETDTSGNRGVRLSIEGTFKGMTRIDQKVITTDLATKVDKDTDVLKTTVKNYYDVTLTKFNPLIWKDSFSLSYDEIFTELELEQKPQKHAKMKKEGQSSAKKEQKQKLNSLDDLFNLDVTGLFTAPRCILIEGEAGGGKTTFLSKEALDAVSRKTELGRRHDIVLLIRLREVREGETIEEMVWDQCVDEATESIDVQSIRAILQRNKSRVLFLLDGYDELRPDARAAGQAIPKLLSGKMYTNSTIAITSRPSAGVQQYTRPDCHVHIMGFSPKHMVKYVRKYFMITESPALAENFIRQYFTINDDERGKVYLKKNELLNSLIKTPMFLLLVCLLWEEDQEMVSTGTVTGLYNNLLTCLVRKYCKRKGVDMPTEGLPTEVAESLLQLGKLALEALLRNETLIDLSKVEREKIDWKLLLKLGVVSLEISSSKLHPRKQLNFSHKTMQEFVAGRYVAHAHALVNQDIVELLQLTSISKVLELGNLRQFTCGCDSRAAQAVMEELSKLGKREFTHLRPEHFERSHVPMDRDMQKSCKTYERFAALCLTILGERQEPEVLHGISQALPIVMLDSSIISREATTLKYYIQNLHSANLPDRLILKIRGGTDSRDTVQYLQQCFTTSLPPGLRLDLALPGWFASPGETAWLVSVLKNVPGLRALGLSLTDLTPSSLQPLVLGFSHMSLLEELHLSDNRDLGDAGMEVLQIGLSSVPHLAVLRLREVRMTAEGMSSLAPYMRHLVGLRELDISSNYKIGDTGLESLTAILPIFTAMQVLVLSWIGIRPTGMRTLAPALCQLTRLIKLDIRNNAIGDPGLECLAAILHHLTAMKVLVLSFTGISDRGISSLVKALPHLVQLQVLDVMYNDIGDSGIVSLVQTLCQPSSLDMEQNPHGDKSLTTAPHYNNTLQVLNIRSNDGVTGAGLGRVAQLISALTALTRLDMSGYSRYPPAHLSDTAAMALAEALPRLPALEELNLRCISMEPAGFQAVMQAAEEHPTLEWLEYSKDLVPKGADTTASCLRLTWP